MTLGFADPWITLAFLLCLGSAALCVIYGYLNWNSGGDAPEKPSPEDEAWIHEEEELEDEL